MVVQISLTRPAGLVTDQRQQPGRDVLDSNGNLGFKDGTNLSFGMLISFKLHG